MNSKIDTSKIGDAIALLRKRAGYTQRELADRIGISDKAVSKWERGQGLPDIAYLRKLSILLDTDSDSLLEGNVVRHNNEWQGILVLDWNENGIGAETIVYDKPLISYLLGYFLLLGIKIIHIVCESEDRSYLDRFLGDGREYGIHVEYHDSLKSISAAESTNLMIVFGKSILYGVDQTRFFQKAMVEKKRLTILALPKRAEAIQIGLDMRVLDSNKHERLRTQYDYSRIPFCFIPVSMLKALSEERTVSDFINKNEAYVEMLDRGFVDIEINDWNDVQDAATFMRIVQDKCGMNVYCLEEIAWRRGLISLEQLKALGEKKANTEYGAYILGLYESMKKSKRRVERLDKKTL